MLSETKTEIPKNLWGFAITTLIALVLFTVLMTAGIVGYVKNPQDVVSAIFLMGGVYGLYHALSRSFSVVIKR